MSWRRPPRRHSLPILESEALTANCGATSTAFVRDIETCQGTCCRTRRPGAGSRDDRGSRGPADQAGEYRSPSECAAIRAGHCSAHPPSRRGPAVYGGTGDHPRPSRGRDAAGGQTARASSRHRGRERRATRPVASPTSAAGRDGSARRAASARRRRSSRCWRHGSGDAAGPRRARRIVPPTPAGRRPCAHCHGSRAETRDRSSWLCSRSTLRANRSSLSAHAAQCLSRVPHVARARANPVGRLRSILARTWLRNGQPRSGSNSVARRPGRHANPPSRQADYVVHGLGLRYSAARSDMENRWPPPNHRSDDRLHRRHRPCQRYFTTATALAVADMIGIGVFTSLASRSSASRRASPSSRCGRSVASSRFAARSPTPNCDRAAALGRRVQFSVAHLSPRTRLSRGGFRRRSDLQRP